MKKFIAFKTFIAVLIFAGFTLISCNDDYEIIPVKLTDVNGNYKAKLITSQGNLGTEKIIEFTAKDTVITFKEFPIREIVKAVVQDPAKVDAAVAAIGKIEYKLDYTSKINTDHNVIELSFEPKTLTLQIPVNGTNRNTVVTLAAKQKGFFVGQDWSLRFGLVAEKITMDGIVLTPFETIKYDFPYCVKY